MTGASIKSPLIATAVARAAARLTQESPVPSGLCNILFVGPDAAALHASCTTAGPTTLAESFLEAILLSGQGTTYDLIVAGVSQEAACLQRALESLRSVNPQARIHLLAEPGDEPLCRRALRWGADEYHILPTTLAAVLQAELAACPAAEAPKARAESPAPGWRDIPEITVLNLPLIVQVSLMDAIMQSRGDLPQRALALLQDYRPWSGKLQLLPVASPPEATRVSAPVLYDQTSFGHLVLAGDAASPNDRPLLTQAAAWLAGWLALSRRQDQLRTLAITDELSGAYNRRYFLRFVSSLLDKARANRFRVSLLLFDIDDFKKYNDQFGHAAGDAIIRNLIGLLRRCTRPHDLVARIGGDEFAVVFWDAEAPRQPNSEHPRDAIAATERFRKAIAAHDWCAQCKIQGQVSVSGGIATFPWDADTLEQLVAEADAALLKAKRAGKNAILLRQAAASA